MTDTDGVLKNPHPVSGITPTAAHQTMSTPKRTLFPHNLKCKSMHTALQSQFMFSTLFPASPITSHAVWVTHCCLTVGFRKVYGLVLANSHELVISTFSQTDCRALIYQQNKYPIKFAYIDFRWKIFYTASVPWVRWTLCTAAMKSICHRHLGT